MGIIAIIKGFWRKFGWLAVAVSVLGGAIYWPALRVPFYFDDHYTILNNLQIRDLHDLAGLWRLDPSRFLTHLSFALNYACGGLDHLGYHVVNIVLHGFNVFLVYILVNIFLARLSLPVLDTLSRGRLSLTAALIFLCHPLQTQAVTYISQRSTLLAAFCYLLTLILYLQYRCSGRALFFGWALAVNFIGVFTKPIIFTLPLAILLCEIFLFDDIRRHKAKLAKHWVPFLLLSFIVPILLVLWRHKQMHFNLLGTVLQETPTISRSAYFLTQLNVLMTYARLLIWPAGQCLDYDYPVTTSFFNLPTVMSALVLLGTGWLVVKLFSRQPVISFGIAWMAVTLSLESSVFPIADVINEHRLYLPMLGFALLVAYGILRLSGGSSRWYFGLTLTVLLWYSGFAHARNIEWQDPTAFYEKMIRRFPRKARLYNNLAGIYYLDYGQKQRAAELYKKSIELDPEYIDAHLNLALIYKRNARSPEALKLVLRAIALDPQAARGYYYAGEIYRAADNYHQEKAMGYFLKSLELDDSFVPAMVALAHEYLNLQDFQRSQFYLEKALRSHTGYPPAYRVYGDWFRRQGDIYRARDYYLLTLKYNPREAVVYNNLGNIYDMLGDKDSALAHYQRAVELAPDYPASYTNLAHFWERAGDSRKAKMYGEKARELQHHRPGNNGGEQEN